MMQRAQFEQWVPFPLERVFLFFANPGNLPRIMPPQTGAELLGLRLVAPPGISPVRSTVTDAPPLAGVGSEIFTAFRLVPFLPFRGRWTALITEFEWNHEFADVQKKGPFQKFHHRHSFRSETRDGQTGTLVRDEIEYDVGWGALGNLVQRFFIGPQLRKVFEYRQRALPGLLA